MGEGNRVQVVRRRGMANRLTVVFRLRWRGVVTQRSAALRAARKQCAIATWRLYARIRFPTRHSHRNRRTCDAQTWSSAIRPRR